MTWPRCSASTSGALPPVFAAQYPKPLRIGIRGDLAKRFPGADFAKLKIWFRRWCATAAYRKAIAKSVARYDLADRLAGEVTVLEAAHARRSLGKKVFATSSKSSTSRPILRLP